MASASIHQAIHGYGDGHRLFSCSTVLNSDSARAMLAMSDMSGPNMCRGFEEYLTGYPLVDSDFFVFAKTWYAAEMPRPGCVWTHSLLVPRSWITSVSSAELMAHLRRPRSANAETDAAKPVVIGDDASITNSRNCIEDKMSAVSVVGAVLGQPRPVIAFANTSGDFEGIFLRLWDELVPTEWRTRFSFCTGALAPRICAGALLDVQAVPRSVPPPRYRSSARYAHFLDVRRHNEHKTWADRVLDGVSNGDSSFRQWTESVAGPNASRRTISSIAPIYGEWHAPNASVRTAFAGVIASKGVDSCVFARLIDMLFDWARAESGIAGRRELLEFVCDCRDNELVWSETRIEYQTRRIFEESRGEGIVLVLSLLANETGAAGKIVLQTAIGILEPSDIEVFPDLSEQSARRIVSINPLLARAKNLWRQIGSRCADSLLSQISEADIDDDTRRSIVDAVFASGCRASVDALVGFGGKLTIRLALGALSSGSLSFSGGWRNAISAFPLEVIEWLERLVSPSLFEIGIASHTVNPNFAQSRLAKVWTKVACGSVSFAIREASFGLTLAFSEGDINSPLFPACFQRVYDAAGAARLTNEEWDWLNDHVPRVNRWRGWDRCERIADALAQLLVISNASLETLFGIVHSRSAMEKLTDILRSRWDTRVYLKSLRGAAESSNAGSRDQREALLKDA